MDLGDLTNEPASKLAAQLEEALLKREDAELLLETAQNARASAQSLITQLVNELDRRLAPL